MRISGERLREARENKRLSQESLARKVGTKQPNISRWEKDGADDLPATVLRNILKELDVSEAYLREERTSPAPNAATKKPDSSGVPAEENSDWQVRIEKSLAKAFDHDQHTLRDLDNIRAVLREAPYFSELLDADRAASVWLDACARLRTAGLPITGASLAVAMMTLPNETVATSTQTTPRTTSPPAMAATGTRTARHG